MKRLSILFIASALLFPVGCASQGLKPTTHSWTITGSIPGETIPAGYSWFFFKETLGAGQVTCDAPTSTNYHQINATGQASPTITDSTAAGTTICAFLQFQDGATPAATSPYSNVVGPLIVPANPTAPAANATQAENESPGAPGSPLIANSTKKPVGDPSMFVYAHQRQKPVAVAYVR